MEHCGYMILSLSLSLLDKTTAVRGKLSGRVVIRPVSVRGQLCTQYRQEGDGRKICTSGPSSLLSPLHRLCNEGLTGKCDGNYAVICRVSKTQELGLLLRSDRRKL